MAGWIRLHRCLADKAIWQCSTPEQKTILITLLLMANYKEKEWEWEGEKYLVQPGQFVTSLKSIAHKAGNGISIQNVRTALDKFEKYEFLTSKPTNKNRLVTIVNWELYQSEEDELTNKLTSNQQATNKQLTTNKKVKKDNKVKNNYIYSTIDDYSDNEKLKQSLKDFTDMREKIKSSMTDKAFDMLLKKLDELAKTDEHKIKLLEQSIFNNWKSIYPLKQQGNFNNQDLSNNPFRDIFEEAINGEQN